MAESNEAFIREWAERAYDRSQLAAIQAAQDYMCEYATNAWRPMTIPPPANTMLVTVVEEGLALMILTNLGEWRTSTGQPHKPPRCWMPAPRLPEASAPRAIKV